MEENMSSTESERTAEDSQDEFESIKVEKPSLAKIEQLGSL